MSPARRLAPVLLCLALGACGSEQDVAPAAAAGGDALEALPAPQAVGPVTGMPDGPGPGEVPLDGAQAAATTVDGVAMVVPIPGVASLDGLPPLEDEPEAGLVAGDPPLVLVGEPPAPLGDASPALPAAGDPGQPAVGEPAGAAAGEAVAVVRSYYAAIAAGRYAQAYALWSDGGRSSGQTPQQFAAGFADTRAIRVQPGEPGRVDGTDGSRRVEVPVSVTSTRADGSEQRYVGTYILRQATADGAGSGWRITSAELREYQP